MGQESRGAYSTLAFARSSSWYFCRRCCCSLLRDLRLHFFQLRQLRLADIVDADDVVAELRLDGGGRGLALLELDHCLGELGHEARGVGPVEIAAVGARSRVLALLLGDVLELGALLQVGHDLLGLVLGLDQDVAGLVFLAAVGRHELVVLGLHLGIGDRAGLAVVLEQRADQDGLAGEFELVPVVVGGVQALLLRFLHEHFARDDFLAQLALHFRRDRAAGRGQLLGQHVHARLGHGLAVDDGCVLRHGRQRNRTEQRCGRNGLQELFFHEMNIRLEGKCACRKKRVEKSGEEEKKREERKGVGPPRPYRRVPAIERLRAPRWRWRADPVR